MSLEASQEENLNAGFEEMAFRKPAETVGIQMDAGQILWNLKHSGRFFIQFFLGEELEFDIPDFHLESWELLTMPDILNIALALPRGHAKTTLMKLAVVWHFLFSPYRFAVYLSNTLAIASEACKDIINYLQSDNFVSMFGAVLFQTAQDTRGFYKFKLYIPDGTGNSIEKFCILRALGAGQQVRGMNVDNTRPELACVDDLEDDENTATALLQRKIISWFYGPFMKALTRRRPKIMYAGNMLSNKSILYHIVVKSDLWHSIRYGCLKSDGTPLWEDLWSKDAIRADYLEYQKLGLVARWFAEMMNMPMAEGAGLIEGSQIPYASPLVPGEQEAAFVTVDPAISKEVWGNDTAIAVHALMNGVWHITEFVTGKYQPDQLFLMLVELCHKWNTRAVGVEAAGYQKVLKFVFDVLAQMYNQSFETHLVPHKNRSKTERLVAWCSLLRKGVWVLEEGDFAITEQLLQYDPLKTNNVDDLIDACAQGPTMVELYLPSIMERYEVDPARFAISTGYSVCAN